jgi:hypothetical protein
VHVETTRAARLGSEPGFARRPSSVAPAAAASRQIKHGEGNGRQRTRAAGEVTEKSRLLPGHVISRSPHLPIGPWWLWRALTARVGAAAA